MYMCVCVFVYASIQRARHTLRQLLELIHLTNSGGWRIVGRRGEENNATSPPLSLVLSGTGHVVIARRETSGPWTFFTDVAPFVHSSQLALSGLCCTAQGNEVQYTAPTPHPSKKYPSPLFLSSCHYHQTRGCVKR